MNEQRKKETVSGRDEFCEKVGEKEARKIKARAERKENLWFGFGMFGLVGWSVAVPTLIGVSIGLWIDGKWPSRYSWTLMFLIAGAALGCLNAWHWVKRESRR